MATPASRHNAGVRSGDQRPCASGLTGSGLLQDPGSDRCCWLAARWVFVMVPRALVFRAVGWLVLAALVLSLGPGLVGSPLVRGPREVWFPG